MQLSFHAIKNTIVLRIKALAAKVGPVKLAVVIAIVLIGGVVVTQSALRGDSVAEGESYAPLVRTASVEELIQNRGSISALGEVRSQAEATIQTESQGQIIRVNYALGDFVGAGSIIAELENASERASVQQAQASLDKLVQGISREENDARISAINTYRNAFTIADDAVTNRADQFFNNPLTSAPSITIGYFYISDINSRRGQINDMLTRWQNAVSTLTTSGDIDAALSQAQSDLTFIKQFLDDLATLVNRQEASSTLSQATLDAQKASVAVARTNLDAAIANVTAAQDNIVSKSTSGVLSERQSEIAVAEAALSAARATLEKTIVRAPISGTINALDLERGDFVSAFTPVVTIANNNALQIESFITADDKAQIAIGNTVIIDGRYNGVVTNIAPGLDPATNKVKVEIGVEETAESLTHGDSVRIAIERNQVTEVARSSTEIIIPITALKVETDRIVVFTVSNDGTLIAHPITEGPLVGSNIVIREGVTFDMTIVLDARGLNEGDRVEVAK